MESPTADYFDYNDIGLVDWLDVDCIAFKPIGWLDSHCFTVLRRLKCKTLRDLSRHYEGEVIGTKQCGPATFGRLERALHRCGGDFCRDYG